MYSIASRLVSSIYMDVCIYTYVCTCTVMYIHAQLCMYIDCKYIYGCVPNTMNLISKYCALKIIINCFHTSHFISNFEIQYVRLKLLY